MTRLLLTGLALALATGMLAEEPSRVIATTPTFNKAITWEHDFDPATDAQAPLRCLVRVQLHNEQSPVNWMNSLLLYRPSAQAPLMARLVLQDPTDKEHRTEFNYESDHPLPAGHHRCRLELKAHMDPTLGSVRLIIDNQPVRWTKCTVWEFPARIVTRIRGMSEERITGDCPTAFAAEGSWIVNGDRSAPGFTSTLISITDL